MRQYIKRKKVASVTGIIRGKTYGFPPLTLASLRSDSRPLSLTTLGLGPTRPSPRSSKTIKHFINNLRLRPFVQVCGEACVAPEIEEFEARSGFVR